MMIDRATALLSELGAVAGDWRTTVLNVQPSSAEGRLVLEGEVLDAELRDRVVQQIAAAYPEVEILDRIAVLVDGPAYGWATVCWPVLNLRREPKHGAELLSQATLGEGVEVLRREGDWCFVRVRDGYLAWADSLGLLAASRQQALGYRAESAHLVAHSLVPCYDERGRQVALLPFGTPLQVERFAAGTAYLCTPQGETWRVSGDMLINRSERPPLTSEGFTRLLGVLERLVGTPYLWGGVTPFGYDCSGLVQAALGFLGVELPRDADMQSLRGREVEQDAIRKGDLLFFTSDKRADSGTQRFQHVTHVAMAVDADRIIHANQRYWAVTMNTLAPGRPDSLAQLRPLLVAVRRYSDEDRS